MFVENLDADAQVDIFGDERVSFFDTLTPPVKELPTNDWAETTMVHVVLTIVDRGSCVIILCLYTNISIVARRQPRIIFESPHVSKHEYHVCFVDWIDAVYVHYIVHSSLGRVPFKSNTGREQREEGTQQLSSLKKR